MINTRTVVVVTVSASLTVLATVVALTRGDYPIDLGRVIDILLGREQGFARTVVVEWRLPRAVAATLFGAALGVSGAIFQSLTRNPLGSPDVIGFNAGAYTGALVAFLWWGGGNWPTAGAAVIGGGLAALLVYGLSRRHGPAGLSFILMGVAVAAGLTALNTLLVMRMGTNAAILVSIWGQGTLENLRWHHVGPMSAALAVPFVVAGLLARQLRQLELGDDVARSSGVGVRHVRPVFLAVGVVLTAVVTSICGPISFVALAAPQIARLLSRSPGVSLIGAAAVGAVMLSLADVVASQALPVGVPVGVVTVVFGGAYLTWLVGRLVRGR